MKKKHRSNHHPGTRLVAVIFIILIAGLLIPAWLFSGYIECRGVIEPADWFPVYGPVDGTVLTGLLTDGMGLDKGALILETDNSWILGNLEKIDAELSALKIEEKYMQELMVLFRRHRDIDAGELHRLMEADRLLEASSSVSRNDMLHSRFLFESFLAGAAREETDLLGNMARLHASRAQLESERRLWLDRYSDSRLEAPVDGIFYSAETVFGINDTPLLPPLGPGRRVEAGQLLGYIIPGGELRIRILLPQDKIGQCHPGQDVKIIPDARPGRAYTPLRGTIMTLSAVASGGFVPGEVALADPEETRNLEMLLCGSLTARIETGGNHSERFLTRIWEKWVYLVNPA